MYEIRIPDHVYQQATQAAIAQHITLEEFVIKALQLHAREDNEDQAFLTPKRITEIREAQAEARTGNNIGLEQYELQAQQRRAEWQTNSPV